MVKSTFETLPDRPCRTGGIVLIGFNPAPPSVAAGHYYQGRLGQRLWARLRALGLLRDGGWEDDAWVAAGNGLTDLVKRPTPGADQLAPGELASGRAGLAARLREWTPGLLLFAYRPPAEGAPRAARGGRSVRSVRGGADVLDDEPVPAHDRDDGQ